MDSGEVLGRVVFKVPLWDCEEVTRGEGPMAARWTFEVGLRSISSDPKFATSESDNSELSNSTTN